MNTTQEPQNDSFTQFITSFRGNGSSKRAVNLPIALPKQEWQALRQLANHYKYDLGEMFSRVFSNVDDPHKLLEDIEIKERELPEGSENVTVELNINLQFSEWTTIAKLAQIRLATIPDTICHAFQVRQDPCDLIDELYGEELVELED